MSTTTTTIDPLRMAQLGEALISAPAGVSQELIESAGQMLLAIAKASSGTRARAMLAALWDQSAQIESAMIQIGDESVSIQVYLKDNETAIRAYQAWAATREA